MDFYDLLSNKGNPSTNPLATHDSPLDPNWVSHVVVLFKDFMIFISHMQGTYGNVVSQVLPLNVFCETPSLALTSSIVHPSGSVIFQQRLGGSLCTLFSMGHHEKVAWWDIEQQKLFEVLAAPLRPLAYQVAGDNGSSHCYNLNTHDAKGHHTIIEPFTDCVIW